jgi:hypothetical protein
LKGLWERFKIYSNLELRDSFVSSLDGHAFTPAVTESGIRTPFLGCLDEPDRCNKVVKRIKLKYTIWELALGRIVTFVIRGAIL